MKIERPGSRQPIPENASRVFEGEIFDVYQWKQTMFDGTTATFEKLKRPDTVVVFPVMDNGDILLIENIQPAKSKHLGGVSGRVDSGEEILDAAKRELLEETGYEATDWVLWQAIQPDSKMDYAVVTFIAKGLKKIADQSLDAGEKINLKPTLFKDFIELAYSDDFAIYPITRLMLIALSKPEKMEELINLFKP